MMSQTIIQTAVLVFAAGFIGFALGWLAAHLLGAGGGERRDGRPAGRNQ